MTWWGDCCCAEDAETVDENLAVLLALLATSLLNVDLCSENSAPFSMTVWLEASWEAFELVLLTLLVGGI